MATKKKFEELECWQKCRELCKSQLYRALDQEYITIDEFNRTYTLADESSRLVTGLIKYLKDSEIKGLKFK